LQTCLRVIITACFELREMTMHQADPQERWSHAGSHVDRDAKMKQAIECLKIENSRLKQLVVRLSETIIRNVIATR
jgi:hypothetical protein